MVTLTNVGSTYDAIAASQGLGMGIIDFRGATTIRFWVHVQKVGTGTQSWQLYNVDDNTEICVLNDAGSAAIRSLEQTFSVNISGVKRVRVRAKSTVATDDPVFLGCAIYLDVP